jgi:azurin
MKSLLSATLVLAVLIGGTTAGWSQGPAAPSARTINLTASDPVDGKMTYSLSQISAKPGERLRIVLTSTGTLPKLVMGHNFVLLKAGVDPKAFSEEAMAARDTDFIPASRKAQIVAHTLLVGPGERDEVTFTVPKVAGSYPYLCSFAGHFAAGMSGVLLVK